MKFTHSEPTFMRPFDPSSSHQAAVASLIKTRGHFAPFTESEIIQLRELTKKYLQERSYFENHMLRARANLEAFEFGEFQKTSRETFQNFYEQLKLLQQEQFTRRSLEISLKASFKTNLIPDLLALAFEAYLISHFDSFKKSFVFARKIHEIQIIALNTLKALSEESCAEYEKIALFHHHILGHQRLLQKESREYNTIHQAYKYKMLELQEILCRQKLESDAKSEKDQIKIDEHQQALQTASFSFRSTNLVSHHSDLFNMYSKFISHLFIIYQNDITNEINAFDRMKSLFNDASASFYAKKLIQILYDDHNEYANELYPLYLHLFTEIYSRFQNESTLLKKRFDAKRELQLSQKQADDFAAAELQARLTITKIENQCHEALLKTRREVINRIPNFNLNLKLYLEKFWHSGCKHHALLEKNLFKVTALLDKNPKENLAFFRINYIFYILNQINIITNSENLDLPTQLNILTFSLIMQNLSRKFLLEMPPIFLQRISQDPQIMRFLKASYKLTGNTRQNLSADILPFKTDTVWFDETVIRLITLLIDQFDSYLLITELIYKHTLFELSRQKKSVLDEEKNAALIDIMNGFLIAMVNKLSCQLVYHPLSHISEFVLFKISLPITLNDLHGQHILTENFEGPFQDYLVKLEKADELFFHTMIDAYTDTIDALKESAEINQEPLTNIPATFKPLVTLTKATFAGRFSDFFQSEAITPATTKSRAPVSAV